MPGFNIGGQGSGPSSTMELLYSHRWMIETLGPVGRDAAQIARDLTLPSVRITPHEINGGTLTYKFAKGVKWDDVTIILYDNGKVYNELKKWLDKVYTNAEGIKVHTPGVGYKQNSVFKLLDGRGENVNKITLRNSWPLVVEQGKLTYTNSDLKIITVTLSYDWADFE